MRYKLFILFIIMALSVTACKSQQAEDDIVDSHPVSVEHTEVLPDIQVTEEETYVIDKHNSVEEDNSAMDFYITDISDQLFDKMYGKTYKEDCTVSREKLRYVHVLHVGFDNQTHEGELVCHEYIAEDLLEIFQELYQQGYQIERICLPDEYDADDEAQMRDNNSSCFNFRFISHTTTVSKHGLGAAVDINTLYNPYIKEVNGKINIEPATAEEYVDRTRDFLHKIDENDLAYKLFTEHGFEWGGAWKNSKDYQHFELPDEVVDELRAQL